MAHLVFQITKQANLPSFLPRIIQHLWCVGRDPAWNTVCHPAISIRRSRTRLGRTCITFRTSLKMNYGDNLAMPFTYWVSIWLEPM